MRMYYDRPTLLFTLKAEKRIEHVMKTKAKSLILFLTLLALLLAPHLTSAYYDPGAQRWLNRDPLGDIGSLASGSTSDEELAAGWTNIRENLFGALGNCPLSRYDPFGLQCHMWNIQNEKDPDPTLADLNQRVNKQADQANAEMIEDLNKLKRETVKDVGIATVGEALGAEMATANLLSRTGKTVLRGKQYFRITRGWVPKAGEKQLRIAFGARDKWLHGHVDSSNWYKPWNWFQKIGNWKNYGCK